MASRRYHPAVQLHSSSAPLRTVEKVVESGRARKREGGQRREKARERAKARNADNEGIKTPRKKAQERGGGRERRDKRRNSHKSNGRKTAGEKINALL